MDTPSREAAILNKAVAAEVRALLARKRMRQSAFATQLGQDEVWVSRRLRCVVPLSLNDLEAMCRVLRAEPADLIAAALRADPETFQCSLTLAEGTKNRPDDNRPPGRPTGRGDRSVSTSPGTRRPKRIGSLNAVPLPGAAA